MKHSSINYHKGKAKYQLVEDYVIDIEFSQAVDIEANLVKLSANGTLTVGTGFAWDGVTGLAFDTRNFMRASLVHDALYHLLRQTGTNPKLHEKADELFLTIAKIDGVHPLRARIHYTNLYLARIIGLTPGKKKSGYTAP